MAIKRRETVPTSTETKHVPSFFDRSGDYVPKPKEPLPDPRIFEEMEPAQIRRAGYFLTANPEDVAEAINVGDLVIAMRTSNNEGEYAEAKYRARVRNRGTAITAFCVDCKGGSRRDVTECEMTECPLWGFRFGTDPFRKRR